MAYLVLYSTKEPVYAISAMLRRHLHLILGIILVATGIIMAQVSSNILGTMAQCKNHDAVRFLPGTVAKAECEVTRNIGQDLMFRALVYSIGTGEGVDIPAHVSIMDPSNATLYDQDFNKEVIISFSPTTFGKYTAIVTNLEDPRTAIPRESFGHVMDFALGYLTGYRDVYNPVGEALNWMGVFSNPLQVAGVGLVIYGIVKVIRKRRAPVNTPT